MIRPARDQRGFTKIPYSDWQAFRRDLKVLREALSWTEISNAAGKVNKGWAANAFEHRSIVAPRDLRTVRKLVKDLQGREKMKNDSTRRRELSAQEAGEMLGYLDRLLEHYRPAELTRLLGAKSRSTIIAIRKRKGYCSRKIFESARGLVEELPVGFADPEESFAEVLENAEVVEAVENVEVVEMPSVVGPPSGQDSFAWLAHVEKGLLELAILIDNEAILVPETFRGPYDTLKEKLLNVAQDFQR